MKDWWAGRDSNPQPDRYERPALTIELPAPKPLGDPRPILLWPYRAISLHDKICMVWKPIPISRTNYKGTKIGAHRRG